MKPLNMPRQSTATILDTRLRQVIYSQPADAYEALNNVELEVLTQTRHLILDVTRNVKEDADR